jgi:two-component sensor histidine kinase
MPVNQILRGCNCCWIIGRYLNSVSGDKPALNDSALYYYSKAENLSGSLVYIAGLGRSYQLAGRIYCSKHNFAKGDEYTGKALALFLDHHLWQDAAETYLNKEEFYVASGGQDLKVRIGYYEQGWPLFVKAGAKKRAGEALQALGDFYQLTEDNLKALERLKLALSLFQSTNYPLLQSTYDLLGYVNWKKDNFSEALKYAQLAVKTAEAVGDSTMQLCTIYNRIGLIYYATYKYPQANYYYKKALNIAERHHDNSALMLAANLSSSFITQNKPAEALELLTETQKKHPKLEPEYRIGFDVLFVSVYCSLKRYPEARSYFQKILDVYHSPDQGGPMKNLVLNGITRYYVTVKQFAQAGQYVPEFIKTSRLLPNKRPLLFAYQRAYMVDSAERKYDAAFKSYQRYVKLKDSVFESAKNRQIQQLQVEFDSKQKEKENVSLKSERLLQVNKVKQANYIRNLTLAGIIVLLILIASLYYSYRVNKRNSQAISEKNLSLNQLVTEKEWLLKEIHHRVKNNLQIVMGLLQRQSAYINNDEALAAIQNSENRMHAIALIHQKLYQSENLDLIYMPGYIDEMISYLKDSCGLDNRILFKKQVDEIYLDVSQAVPLGLILNEAITNAIKYAYPDDKTGTICVSLLISNGANNQLMVSDNGPGLPANFNINKVDSLGINLMKGLTNQLGGVFTIGGKQGCSIHVEFRTEVFNRKEVEKSIKEEAVHQYSV